MTSEHLYTLIPPHECPAFPLAHMDHPKPQCLPSKTMTVSSTWSGVVTESSNTLSSVESSGFWEDCDSWSRSAIENWNRTSISTCSTVSQTAPSLIFSDPVKTVCDKNVQPVAEYFNFQTDGAVVRPHGDSVRTKEANDQHHIGVTESRHKQISFWKMASDWSDTDTCGTRRHSRLCSSEDSTDSDDDDDEGENMKNVTREPKTRFEAALRRARLADRQRKLFASSHGSEATGRTMPDWGSPIPLRPALHHAGSNTHTIDSHSNKSIDEIKLGLSDTSASLHDKPPDRSVCPDSPVLRLGKDLCTGIEMWLKARPRKYYACTKTNNAALQLCFISNSEEDLFKPHQNETGPMDEVEIEVLPPTIDDGMCFEAFTSEMTLDRQDSQTMDSMDTTPTPIFSQRDCDQSVIGFSSLCTTASDTKGQLYREHNENMELRLHINELDRHCGLYLEHLLRDCKDENTEVTLTKRLERHLRLQANAQFSLSQLPGIARMQAEVEHCTWSVPSVPITRMLGLNVKPRTPLTISLLHHFNLYQLQLIVNDLHASIQNLNMILLKELSERDDLHSVQEGKSVQIKDLATHFKQLCIRLSVRQMRRQLSQPTESCGRSTISADQVVIHALPQGTPIRRSQILRSLFGRRTALF